ncbi:MAG: hypothetical protein JWO15_1567 [Sphingomonadales bacterium]|nr:hypothetical protein [Sphingomonadales bacterium]
MSVSPALGQNHVPTPSISRAKVTPPTVDSIKTAPPKGFEDIGNAVSTEFDVTFQGRHIGSFKATYSGGSLKFAEPTKIAAALGPDVDTDTVAAFLTNPLSANEQFRCRPGQSLNGGCGILPGGSSGLIVNAETFQVSLFLARAYLISTIAPARTIGPPTSSGLSLIEGVRISAASSGDSAVRYGGTFDTLFSLGRTALVSEISLSDNDGLRAQQLYAQRVWAERRAAVGLLQDFQSLTFASYRVAGAEFGSFYGGLVDPENDTATPLEVLLPKRAQVEVYRDGVLLSTGQYEPGLQLIDTRNLPSGSYTVRLVARDGPLILLDQTRSFSKIGSLVPPGKTAFRIRAGERLSDNFLDATENGDARGGFIPKGTGELVASGFAQRRLGKSLAASVTVTSFDSRVYGETGLQIFHGKLSGVLSAGLGSNGVYAAQVSGSLLMSKISFYLSARKVHANDSTGISPTDDRYQPFFRSQDSIFGSAQVQALGGSFSLTGSYTRSPDFPDRYAAGLQYTRSMRMPLVGTALLTVGGTKSDFDSRVGISISFFKQVDSKTDASFTAGGQYVPKSSTGGGRTGVSPVAEATITRTERLGAVDVTGQGGGATDADSDRVFAQLRGQSPYGSADATAQYQTRSSSGNGTSVLFNGQTGFAIGGGAIKLGLRNPADSMVIVDLTNLKLPTSSTVSPAGAGDISVEHGDPETGVKVAQGGYRITVNSKPLDYVEPGGRIAIGVPAYKEYTIGLKPEGAPQFDLTGTEKTVTLYPGNVTRVRFQAQRVVSIYGQIRDATDHPLAGARIEAGNDYTVADDRGYFTITAALTAKLEVRTAVGGACLSRVIGSMVNAKNMSLLYRFGTLHCVTTQSPVPTAPATLPVTPSILPIAPPRKISTNSSNSVVPVVLLANEPELLLSSRTLASADCAPADASRNIESSDKHKSGLAELERVCSSARATLKSTAPDLNSDKPAFADTPLTPLARLVAMKFIELAEKDARAISQPMRDG